MKYEFSKELDLDSLEAEFESAFDDEVEEEEVEETEVEETEEIDEDEQSEDETDESLENDDENELEDPEERSEIDEEEEKAPQPNEEAENYRRQLEALQRQLDEQKQVADIFDQIAKENGVSRDDLVKQYEKSQLESEAQRQNVPVEYLEKQRSMERELKSLKENTLREKFNSQVSNLKKQYNLSDDDVKSTIDFAYQNGIDAFDPNVNLELVYKSANFDKLVEQKVKESRQKELTEKQKRMNKSSVNHGGSGQDSGPSIDEEVQAFLREQGII